MKNRNVLGKVNISLIVNIVAVFLCALTCIGNPDVTDAKEPFKIAYYDNYPPFSYSENGRMKGIFVDILNEIGHRADISVLHLGYPWKRAQEFVAKGENDAFVTAPSKKRKVYAQFTQEPVMTTNIRPFVSSSNPKLSHIRQGKDVSDWKDAIFVAFLGGGWSQKTLSEMKVVWVTKVDQVIKMLADNRADIHLGHSRVTNYQIRRLGFEGKITELPITLDSLDWFVGISKKSSCLSMLPLFEKNIRNMKQDGTMEKIWLRNK